MPVPKMNPVDSSCVAKIGYDPNAEEAYVEFHDSGLYAYRGVPARVFEAFVAAESKGTFVNEVIKPRYPFRKV
ncbi:MAG TPA: KTSC domain-containing protein [Solirubrobacterales bacterium]